MNSKGWATRRLLVALLTITCAIPSLDAFGCSCAPPKSTEEAFKEAEVVVLGEAISITHQPSEASPQSVIVEDDVFRVILAFKGNLKPGDLFRVRSVIYRAGGCGLSAENSPVWIYERNGHPVHLSGIWVVYGGKRQPFTLSGCGPSKPIEGGGLGDLQDLARLTDKPSAKVPTR